MTAAEQRVADFPWPCREKAGRAHGPHNDATALVRDMPDGSERVASISCPGVEAHPLTMAGGSWKP